MNKQKSQLSPTVSVVETGDGTRTLRHEEHGVHYRSCFGAEAESRYVFLSGSRLLHHQQQKRWNILELGLGGGLNFIVTAVAAIQSGVALFYHAVDWSPVDCVSLVKLHEGHTEPRQKQVASMVRDVCTQVHTSPGQQVYQSKAPNASIELYLYPQHWQDTQIFTTPPFDAIYHDPFGPAVNPESWTPACFAWSYAHLASHGVLTTYGAAAHTRAAMVAAGYRIYTRAGYGKKREMTVGTHPQHSIADTSCKALRQQRYWHKAREYWPELCRRSG
ncbi:MAG: tRNA (5-methylaminomethyl-2-thiouridine)(34)-methyltransferase MnmD [Myxococcota bacterium]